MGLHRGLFEKCGSVAWLVLMMGLGCDHDVAAPEVSLAPVDVGPLDGGSNAPPDEKRDGIYRIGWMGNRCLDIGSGPVVQTAAFGGPALGDKVTIRKCDGTSGQNIRILEVGDQYEVELRGAGYCLAPISVSNLSVVTLQTCSGAAAQRWSFDGDTFRSASNGNLVMAPLSGRGAVGTVVALTPRRYDDTEFWTLRHQSGFNVPPHSGFQEVNSIDGLRSAIAHAKVNSVVVVIDSFTTIVDDPREQSIKPSRGVTIRGRPFPDGTLPTIHVQVVPTVPIGTWVPLFEINEEFVRITSLGLNGFSPNTSEDFPHGIGVAIFRDLPMTVDHCDLSAWNRAAVMAISSDDGRVCAALRVLNSNVQVLHNFIHDNRMDSNGYGVVTHSGAYAQINHNTFDGNRHAIAGDGTARSGYTAASNLIQRSAPKQRAYPANPWGYNYDQDFDMHGSEDDAHAGVAGQEVHIVRNTFLADNRYNFNLRGDPCYKAFFTSNVSLLSGDGAIKDQGELGTDEDMVMIPYNQWSSPDPSLGTFGVGDFDGDGRDDLFMATGAGWYYSRSARFPWRSLAAFSTKIQDLRFGDFDGDARTDVLRVDGGGIWVSWGGRSAFQRINTRAVPLADLLVGDFNGDGTSDLLIADGTAWYLSYSGSSPFGFYFLSSLRAKNLRVGFFNADNRADVLGINDGTNWAVVFAGTTTWTVLRKKLSDDLGVIADLNGNGLSDIIIDTNLAPLGSMKVSFDGRSGWATLPASPGIFRGVGRFDTTSGADIVTFGQIIPTLFTEDNFFYLSSKGTASYVKYSLDNMR